ncbi:hypothetical protein GYMLUDRAFT_81588 [Collybiopsis luxurians FD-317 M1]|nr:hypothetical protein GYMLUDRAFT_81588 [Collybiopsis luxurians FD-317 M1]
MLVASLIFIFTLINLVHPSPVQTVFETQAKPRQLHGRFLQITDLHPDPHYEPGTSISKNCHRGDPKKKKKRAGYYGTPHSGCDSPLRLIDYTLDYLEKSWASEIDFVVWTGDNARHDEDSKLPRTTKEIYDTNRAVAKKISQAFTSKGIPVIPSLGPNSITNEFSQIWQSFIPFPYHQVFQRGAYYAVEVVPNRLAVISLNTLYFYDSNKAVGGCMLNEPEDPGNLQFDWLEVQLKSFRDRGMQVWLTGHVPPSSSNYFPECYVRYVHLALRFQDIVVGHLYGHMNADHFFFVEAEDLEFYNSSSRAWDHDYLYDSLLQDFAVFTTSKKIDLDEYSVINVSPPVVPNPYLPTFRIFSYNITGVEDHLTEGGSIQEMDKIDAQKKRLPGHHRGKHGNKASLCKQEPYRDSWKCKLSFSSPSNPSAPSRSSRLWTPLGYAQYFIPSLSDADKTDHPRFKLEYTTLPFSALFPREGQNETEFRYPIPLKNLPKSLRNGEIKNKYFAFNMEDLTVGSWMELARRLGDRKETRLRKKFGKYMSML